MYLTGRFSRNFLASKTENDNLLRQMNISNFNLKYIGSEYPMYFLGGGKQAADPSQNFFNDNHLERDDFPFSIICPGMAQNVFYPVNFGFELPSEFDTLSYSEEKLQSFLEGKYGSQLTPSRFQDCLKMGLKESESLIYYTQIIDSFNHGYSREHPRTVAATYAINKAILKIIEWIDQNPEYALILSSDHGGQAYLGEDNYCNHGCLNPGNEGVLMVYVNEFGKEGGMEISRKMIETFDVSNIIAQVLENVNFPLESEGKVYSLLEKSK